MTAEQLHRVVARTGHERFRWLTSDGNPDASQRRFYRAAVVRLAGDAPSVEPPTPAPLPAVAESLALLKIARNCPHRNIPSCSCVFAMCSKDGQSKSASQCIACVGEQREPAAV